MLVRLTAVLLLVAAVVAAFFAYKVQSSDHHADPICGYYIGEEDSPWGKGWHCIYPPGGMIAR
jgi:hypothetical protein